MENDSLVAVYIKSGRPDNAEKTRKGSNSSEHSVRIEKEMRMP